MQNTFQQDQMLSEEFESLVYSVVAKEISEKHILPGVWTKAYAEAAGDEKKALALYIRLRTPQVAKELLAAIEAEEKQRAYQKVQDDIRSQQRRRSQEQLRAARQREEDDRKREAEKQRAELVRRKTNPIRARCPHCKAAFFIFPKYFGKQIKCAACRKELIVPDPYK